MVVKLLVKILVGFFCLFGFVNPVIYGDNFGELLEAVITHLQCGDPDNLDNWTKDMSLALRRDQQQRLAWNIPWVEIQDKGASQLEMQQQLNPSNPLKLRLWMSFYWHLKRSRSLDPILTTNFALKLRELQKRNEDMWSPALQNMWQSLPKSLKIILQSRWLCLQHKRQMLYVVSGYKLELGANSNCSMWQIQSENQDHWLRLINFCDDSSLFFINLWHSSAEVGMLQSNPSLKASKFCVFNKVGYFKDASKADIDCQWQVNDCSNLPKILNQNKHVS
ncbi:uncharacterized protein Dana_GF26650 [Drosophila ananassae]|uniref:Uncharacterized protein n=1 Tax=Drosophila ananassae TaxID=7217 RepID=A0A0P8XPP3_DROAN|nr:uncharacterized protein Dana_GF26650 [Drosophila ananassae]